jgi:hypothetical protein
MRDLLWLSRTTIYVFHVSSIATIKPGAVRALRQLIEE